MPEDGREMYINMLPKNTGLRVLRGKQLVNTIDINLYDLTVTVITSSNSPVAPFTISYSVLLHSPYPF